MHTARHVSAISVVGFSSDGGRFRAGVYVMGLRSKS